MYLIAKAKFAGRPSFEGSQAYREARQGREEADRIRSEAFSIKKGAGRTTTLPYLTLP